MTLSANCHITPTHSSFYAYYREHIQCTWQFDAYLAKDLEEQHVCAKFRFKLEEKPLFEVLVLFKEYIVGIAMLCATKLGRTPAKADVKSKQRSI